MRQSSSEGMVCAAHPQAVEAGWAMLNAGGSAYDAAVAVAAALNVVEPMMSGIGGYGTILVYDASADRIQFLNASGRIPQAVDSDAFRAPTPNYAANRRSAKAVSTPVNLRAWEALAERGRLAWSQLLEPAIALASDGCEIDSRLASYLNQEFKHFPAHARAIYGNGAKPLSRGETLMQRDLAASLTQIAEEGAAVFYEGEIGRKIHKTIQQANGFLSLNDLRAAEAEWYDPIHITYRGHDVYTAAPPATSFPGLIRLGLLSQYDVAAWEHNSVAHLHYFAEITKHAFWCRLRYAGDPEVEAPPLDWLLSADYWSTVTSNISPDKATRFTPPRPNGEPSQHTTHFVVADKAGNLVSATQTIGQVFGSYIMPEGTGIWLNNSLQYCTFEPAGNPMDAHAGRHKLSGDMPTIIVKNGRPWAALGTPGGHTIAQTVSQLVSNLIDFQMTMQAAIDAPRISFVEPNELQAEDSIGDQTAKALADLGHEIARPQRPIGFAHGLTVSYDAAGQPVQFDGGFDKRGVDAKE